MWCRVEDIASKALLDVEFQPLKKSIRKLQKASIALDKEKSKAQKDLSKLIQKWKKKHHRWHKLKRLARKIRCRVKKIFGRKCACPHKRRDTAEVLGEAIIDHDIFMGMALHEGLEGHIQLLGQHHPHHGHGLPLRKLRKLIRRIRTVNKKVSTFERGFISEEGIKDREWYKHLAVAPGMWLGQSAFCSSEDSPNS